MQKNSKKQDGRGRSPGSRATQFSEKNQPKRNGRRRSKVDPEAADLMHSALYEKVSASRGGKKVKVPFIDAFIRSIRNNALTANISEQIKYLRELQYLGLFDFEEYKQRLFQGMNNYYRKVVASGRVLADAVDELGAAFKKSHMLYIIYFTAYSHARLNCTCGACKRGFNYAVYILPLVAKAISDPEEYLPEDGNEAGACDDGVKEDQGEGDSGHLEDIDDDEFYRGFGFD